MSNKTKKTGPKGINKQIVLEKYHSGLSVANIARELGITVGAVKFHIYSVEPGRPKSEIEFEVSERRKKVLELNHAFKSHEEITTALGLTTKNIVWNDLLELRKDPANKVNGRRQFDTYRNKQKAALPEPAKKITCPGCNGDGVAQTSDGRGEDCLECLDPKTGLGTGQKDSFYGNIVKEPVLPTRNKRIKTFRSLMKYLDLTDWQQLPTWYKIYGIDEYKNNLYFERKVGDGFLVEELQKKRRNEYETQQHIIGDIKAGYELNGITTLPWKKIKAKIAVPEVRKPKRETQKAYTLDQIQTLFHNSDPTYKAVIAFYMSGPRRGGIYQVISPVDRIRYPEKERFLRIRDLKDPLADLNPDQRRDFLLKKPDYQETPLYEMNVYSEDLDKQGKPDHYTCWSTPEFYYLINLVLAKRQKDGELDLIDPQLKNKPFDIEIWREKCPNAPVFRPEYGQTDVATSPIPALAYDAIKSYLAERRRDFLMPMKKWVKLFNGFRSYVETILAHNARTIKGDRLSERELAWFMGRDLPKMGEHYDAWGKTEQLMTFWSALEWLTIGPMREKFLNTKIVGLQNTVEQKDQTASMLERMDKVLGDGQRQTEAEVRMLRDDAMRQRKFMMDLPKFLAMNPEEQQEYIKTLYGTNAITSLPPEQPKKLIRIDDPRKDIITEDKSNNAVFDSEDVRDGGQG